MINKRRRGRRHNGCERNELPREQQFAADGGHHKVKDEDRVATGDGQPEETEECPEDALRTR